MQISKSHIELCLQHLFVVRTNFSLLSQRLDDFDTNKISNSGSGHIRLVNYMPEKTFQPIVNANFKKPHQALATTSACSAHPFFTSQLMFG